MLAKPRYDIAFVAVPQYGERLELLARETSVTCSMLEAGFDRAYQSDPVKDFFIVKCLQFADSSLLLQCGKSVQVPVRVFGK